MALVVATALGIRALVRADEVWAGIVFFVTCAMLAHSIVRVAYVRGPQRAWWLGFAVFGGGYLGLVFSPRNDPTRLPLLPTTRLLEALRDAAGIPRIVFMERDSPESPIGRPADHGADAEQTAMAPSRAGFVSALVVGFQFTGTFRSPTPPEKKRGRT